MAFAPTLNAEDYFTRKGNYAIKALFVCDDMAKITLVEMGWPGSMHDNRVWLNSDVYLAKDIFACYWDNDSFFSDDLRLASTVLVNPLCLSAPRQRL